MKYKALLLLGFSVFNTFAVADNDLVKLSKSGICHDSSSSSYNRTKNFTAFENLETCIAAGGRLPKAFSNNFEDVAANSPQTTYKRSYFGKSWLDEDHDCQNTRAEILIASNTGNLRFSDNKQCRVLSGKWVSPYSGKSIYVAKDTDIDHIVPLSLAWRHGANNWDEKTRFKFANDPSNLVVVEASLNRSKSDKSLDEWLPPTNQCQYALRFIRIVKSYPLVFSDKELQSFSHIKTKYCG